MRPDVAVYETESSAVGSGSEQPAWFSRRAIRHPVATDLLLVLDEHVDRVPVTGAQVR